MSGEVHLLPRDEQHRVFCGRPAYGVSRIGVEHTYRRFGECCARCLAIAALYVRPLPWWAALRRLRRRQIAIRIRAAALEAERSDG